MLRTELVELVVHGFEPDGIELGFEAKMTNAALELEHLQLGVGQHGGKEMGGLRCELPWSCTTSIGTHHPQPKKRRPPRGSRRFSWP